MEVGVNGGSTKVECRRGATVATANPKGATRATGEPLGISPSLKGATGAMRGTGAAGRPS